LTLSLKQFNSEEKPYVVYFIEAIFRPLDNEQSRYFPDQERAKLPANLGNWMPEMGTVPVPFSKSVLALS
jgi:hypothetical protein